MYSSCAEITGHMRRAEELLTGSVHIADPRPLPKSGTFLHPFARFIIPLESRKKITFGSQGREVEAVLEPGDAVFGRPGAWIDEHFELHHRMISVVFYEKFIRYLYIEQLDAGRTGGRMRLPRAADALRRLSRGGGRPVVHRRRPNLEPPRRVAPAEVLP